MKIIIVDFNDSFTFNILSTIRKSDKKIRIDVVHWHKSKDLIIKDRTLVILGPGPGHPNEYESINPFIKSCLENPQIFLMGICLGHQLIWKYKGFKISNSNNLVHGQHEEICLPSWDPIFERTNHNRRVLVQRYNSLAVISSKKSVPEHKTMVKRGEVVMGMFKNGVSYQFHPESVGTSCPNLFFNSALKFLYNDSDEDPPESYRNL
ncbi:MAG: hypothetical protein KC493_15210 [Bacteriovoracaceae bacterium]|nr:hypothetical protein [Bacteriovoracaceae bacterium]